MALRRATVSSQASGSMGGASGNPGGAAAKCVGERVFAAGDHLSPPEKQRACHNCGARLSQPCCAHRPGLARRSIQGVGS
jgi:hypothetical protein